MSRLGLKIEALQSQIADLQDQLSAAEDKMDRQTFKARRKAFRKKIVNDPLFRIAAGIQRVMYEPLKNEPGAVIQGLLDIISASNVCNDCNCGKAESCK